MNGYLALRVIAYVALGIGIAILTHPAWGFIAFGVFILIDNGVFWRRASTPSEEELELERERKQAESSQTK